MQGLADGYFVLPVTIGDYLADAARQEGRRPIAPEFRQAESRRRAIASARLLGAKGTRSVDSFHRELGKIMWEYCGMARTRGRPEEGARR